MGNQKGFTLLEIVLVLILVGILSVLIGSHFVSLNIQTSPLLEAKNQVIAAIATTRNKAIFSEQTQRIEFFNDDKDIAHIQLFKNDGSAMQPSIPLPNASFSATILVNITSRGTLDSSKPLRLELISRGNKEERLVLLVNRNGYVEEGLP